ncbi:hypothetical protein [Bacillus sp. 1P06AnD]|uniref:hypothetical protein n=1 Tax=Bacillus sp. 1P06AnD TaxID=3132208 RepID=UPI0039A189A0
MNLSFNFTDLSLMDLDSQEWASEMVPSEHAIIGMKDEKWMFMCELTGEQVEYIKKQIRKNKHMDDFKSAKILHDASLAELERMKRLQGKLAKQLQLVCPHKKRHSINGRETCKDCGITL